MTLLLVPGREKVGGGTRPLRIGVVAPPFLPVPPPGYGGIERVVSVLVEGLVDRGHDVTLFAGPGSISSARVVTPLADPPLLGDPAAISDEIVHVLHAYLGAERFDVIHDHTGFGPVLGSMLPSTPVVHSLHGPWTAGSRLLLGLITERMHLVAISRHQQASNPALRYAGIVYNGIDLQAHPFHETKEDFLVFMGRISSEKRPELAIQVARLSGRPLVMMVKRTEPSEREYWDQVVAPHLGSDVEVLDQPPQEVKVNLLGRARALLFPIDWPEPFGLVMTEAMACGTPVIARPLGAAPEVIVDGVTGYLCSTLAEMARAVDQADRIRPADCRTHVEQHFSSATMVEGYERVYRSVVSSLGRPGRTLPKRSADSSPTQSAAAVGFS